MSVEIVGRSCLTPGADSPDSLFHLLRNGQCAVTQVPRDRWDQSRYWHPEIGVPGKTYTFAAGIVEDIYAFDSAVFGMSRREAAFLDPQQRIILNLTWRALEDANIDPASLLGQNVGVYIGASGLDHANLIVEDPAAGGPYFMSGNTLSVVSNRISHVLGLSGPSMTIDTACSSSLIALEQAFNAIVSGAIDMAIVGGVNVLSHPLPFIGFAQARMLSPEGLCRAYDDAGEGYVRAEGGAVLILRRSDIAMRERDRSHATIVACASNSAGRTNGISLPSPEAQAALLSSIYHEGGIDPKRLAFVEGHGTGTMVGDPSELWALGTAIGQKRQVPISVGSIKTNIGHAEPASGALGLMKAMLSLEHNFFPASLHFQTPNRKVDLEALNVHVADKGIELLPDRRRRFAGVNSFGFGGTNAHVVICDPPRHEPLKADRSENPVFLASAHSKSALEALVSEYSDGMARAPDLADDLIRTAGANRAWLNHRFVVPDATAARVKHSIRRFLQNEKPEGYRYGTAMRANADVAFVFSGNGSQWAGMGIDAYRDDTRFKARFDEIAALFRLHFEEDLTALLQDEGLSSRLADTTIAQPLLFALQAALADSLISQGLKPAVVFGHSVGEVAAAYAAGALSLVDAVRVVATRSTHQQRTAGMGGMAAIAATAAVATELFGKNGFANLSIAAYNSRESITISGPAEEIQAFVAVARGAKIAATVLDIDYPFHHPMIDPRKDAFIADLSDLVPNKSRLPFISSVTGQELPGTALDAEYWWQNLREPVLFAKAAAAALEGNAKLLLEIGPRPILKAYLADATEVAGHGLALASLVKTPAGGHENPVRSVFSNGLAHGAAIERKSVFGKRNAAIQHPVLPFDHDAPGLAPTSDAVDLYGRQTTTSRLAGWRVNPLGSVWKNHVDAHLLRDLAEHVVDGKAILPATGFLEIATSATQEFLRSEQVEIHDLVLLHPLELKTDQITELSTVISPETNDIEIRSRARLSEDDWTLHAKGRIRHCDAVAKIVTAKRGDAGPVRTRLSADAYATASRLGLCYGPKFQLLASASTSDERTIHVTLKGPQGPTNPYLEYAVNPISADAALHGLIAMLAPQGGRNADAPYIPVRIGCATILSHGATVTGATIEIRSAGTETIRADLTLHDASGRNVLTIRELRLKRTHLRQQASLEARSFHYESVPSLTGHGVRSIDDEALHRWIGALTPEQADSSSLLLGATAYRVAFDTIEAVVDHQRTVPTSALHGDGEQILFQSLCLQWLASAGLATKVETGWKLADTCDVPDIATLISLIDREDGQRLVEALALANASPRDRWRCDVPRTASPRNPMSEATLDHLLTHSLPAQARLGLLEEGVRTILEESSGAAPIVVELGSASASWSGRMAELALEKGGRTIIIEDREHVRDMLTLHFAGMPHVDIVESGNFPKDTRAGLLFSACHDLYSLIADNPRVSVLVRRLTGAGSTVFAVAGAPGIVADMTYGQQPEWLSRIGERIAGPLATQAEWKDLLDSLGVGHCAVRSLSLGSGEIIVLGGLSRTPNDDAGHEAKPTMTAAPVSIGSGKPFEGELEHALRQATDRGAALLYDFPNGAGIDGSTRLQEAMTELALVAERLDALANASSSVPLLLVLLDGGAPAGWDASAMAVDPANAGLWMFLRTVRNEYPDISILSIDCQGQARDGRQFAELIERCDASSGSFEWLRAEDGALREIRAVPGPAAASSLTTTAFEAATVGQAAGSSIAGIGWTTSERTQPSANELLIEVGATGLNFRDVMWAMGMLPPEALEDGFAGMTIGMECAGTVVAIGEGVSRFSIGDRVMAFAPAAFSTHVTVDARAAMALPETISEAAGATIPVAFLTAWYALVELGRLKEGETVLVHGGAGGVGLAALQIAKLRGAKVIATAGSVEKRSLLHLLGADHVLNSRSLAFVAAVERLTDRAGVDVVLNSLSGDAMERSIGLLKPFGRFLELGKRDYYADRKIGLRPFRRNVSYFGIDADQLLLADPSLTQSLFDKLAALFADARLHALTHRVFNHDEIRSAFRLMQGSGHIGKIVVKPPQAGRDAVRRREDAPLEMDPTGMHLVVGGIGGFGLAAADWLVEKGARKIALCSRGGVADDATLDHIRQWDASGVETTVLSCDVTDRVQVETMLAGLRERAPLKSIIHAAMVLDDGLLPNLSPERNKPVVETKALGAEHLDALTREDGLDHFILFSSVTTLIGNIGQANYVAANGYLEGIARRRRTSGLPALAVAFGPISDVGVLAASTALGDRLAKRLGDTAMPAREALRHLESAIIGDRQAVAGSCVVIANLDWPAISRLAVAKSNLFLPVQRSRRGSHGAGISDNRNLAILLADKSEAEAEAMVFAIVAEELAAALQIPLSGVSRNLLLRDAGLDSLMAVELAISLEKRTGFELSLNGLSETATLGELTGKLMAKARKTETTQETAAADNTVRHLASKHSATG